MTADLPDFLLARITEDEEAARAAAGPTDGRWSKPDEWTSRAASAGMNRRQVEHLIRHDPARVLAECEAKQRIVKAGVKAMRLIPARHERAQGYHSGSYGAYSAVLRLLALPYADHPDYKLEWEPPTAEPRLRIRDPRFGTVRYVPVRSRSFHEADGWVVDEE